MNKKSCLVIVDMINGFIKEGALSDPSINLITPGIIEMIKKFRQMEYPIINFQDAHDENANEFKSFPKHCIKGTFESDLIDELKPFASTFITLYKNSTNGFMQPQFLETFSKLACDEFVIVGCCSDICVLQFGLSLQGYINENNLNVKLNVPRDLIETFNAPGHHQDACNATSITLLKAAGVEILKSYKEYDNEQ